MDELNNNAKRGKLLDMVVIDSLITKEVTNYTYQLCTGDIINITVAIVNGNVSVSTLKL